MADGKKKSRLRELKESWYEKVPLNVRQLDIIIAIGFLDSLNSTPGITGLFSVDNVFFTFPS